MTRVVAAALLALALLAPAARADDGLPMQLPGDALASSATDWLVGATPGAASDRIARRFGAQRFALGAYSVKPQRARAFAAALGHRLVYAQPDRKGRLDAVADDPLSGPPNDWRKRVADPSIDPPAVTAQSPLIALVDAAADPTHPEWTNDPFFSTAQGQQITSEHGTATASVATAPANGIGILGVWPGARTLNVPLQTIPGTEGEISCKASAEAIANAIAANPAVINMSYSSPSLCAPEKVQIYYAVARGIIPVAAAGNEFQDQNPLEYPASLPHVVTVAAVDGKDKPAYFSNANAAVDLSAPGTDIMAAVPLALDTEGPKDGYETLSGTSFAAPMVSAAMAWIRAARPDLLPDQALQAVRLSAHDVAGKGYDTSTGFGVLDVGAALKVDKSKLPIHDPGEPNDNIVWVDGTAFGGVPAKAVWSGGRAVRVNALLDKEEDPVDVYRIIIPRRRTAHISVIPRFGDTSLQVFSNSAESINDTARRVGYSHRTGAKATETLNVTNSGSASHPYFVVVQPQGKSLYQERQYTLRVG